MKLLFVADGRSPTALNWVSFFVNRQHDVHLVSLFPCKPEIKLTSMSVLPVAFTLAARTMGGGSRKGRYLRKVVTPKIRTFIRHNFVPASLPQASGKLRTLISKIKPDLVHAMRIPYEGMVAAFALSDLDTPFIVSVWGNDFTLHAESTRKMAEYTTMTLKRADVLHTDCKRDLRLGHSRGFDNKKEGLVLPGSGGVRQDIFHLPTESTNHVEMQKEWVVINPRGFRAYIRNDSFFQSIPTILTKQPKTRFICPSMGGEVQAENWVESYGISHAVELLPYQSRAQMAELFQGADIVVSPSTHDGTPNTILEAMACGCFPVVSELESLREWVTPGVNGLLFDPGNPKELSKAVLSAIEKPELIIRSRDYNSRLINERADYWTNLEQVEILYKNIV